MARHIASSSKDPRSPPSYLYLSHSLLLTRHGSGDLQSRHNIAMRWDSDKSIRCHLCLSRGNGMPSPTTLSDSLQTRLPPPGKLPRTARTRSPLWRLGRSEQVDCRRNSLGYLNMWLWAGQGESERDSIAIRPYITPSCECKPSHGLIHTSVSHFSLQFRAREGQHMHRERKHRQPSLVSLRLIALQGYGGARDRKGRSCRPLRRHLCLQQAGEVEVAANAWA